ncbi:MAG: hypothetical protein ACTSU2_07130 [Promethearchaeota archaeon]
MANLEINESGSVDDSKLLEFVRIMIKRGLGLYGPEEMAKICLDSGIAFTDDLEVEWLKDDHNKCVHDLLVNYGSRNLPAKMTAIVLSRRYGIPTPQELLEQKKKRRFRIFRRKK